jgi:hypothetical protein
MPFPFKTLSPKVPGGRPPTLPTKPAAGDYYGGSGVVVTENPMPNSQLMRFRIALIVAIAADALQFILLPLFVEGAGSPADDVLDVGVAAALFYLLGWHWEFLPSFAAKLVPGVDLVPLWTLAVANVYRRSKRIAASEAQGQQNP